VKPLVGYTSEEVNSFEEPKSLRQQLLHLKKRKHSMSSAYDSPNQTPSSQAPGEQLEVEIEQFKRQKIDHWVKETSRQSKTRF
jgi:hypothetical protein